MKKVIFVGGTAYSGSTLLDLTLGHDARGFSCGEVNAYFRPFRPHHVDPDCGCGNPQCGLWQEIKAAGEERLYQTIFERLPNVEFIVDSSKDPLWIRSQVRNLARQGIETKHILIWKTPVEMAASWAKHGHTVSWEKAWVNYHRLYHTVVDDWCAVKYRNYAQNPSILQSLCAYLDIPHWEGKERFWEGRHHLLFGNDNTRTHLYRGDSSNFGKVRNGLSNGERDHLQQSHRTIYYRPVTDGALEAAADQTIRNSTYVSELVEMLEEHDVVTPSSRVHPRSQLRMAWDEVALRQLKRTAVIRLGERVLGGQQPMPVHHR